MKKKLIALILSCATLSLAILPSAFAAAGDATLTVTGGSIASPSAAGAYSAGLYFNLTRASGAEVAAESDSGGTNLVNATDYMTVTATNVTDAWALQVLGASITSTGSGNTFSLAGTATATAVRIRLDGTDANSVTRSKSISSTTGYAGGVCGVVATDVTAANINLSGTAQSAYTVAQTNSGDCLGYTVKFSPVIDITPITSGFSTKDNNATTTLTFSATTT